MKKNKEEPKSKNYAIILRKKRSMIKTIQILVATAVAGINWMCGAEVTRVAKSWEARKGKTQVNR
ncbi:hypothetical protein [Campylobacter hyointestinalis]|uniref:hypothetical protein n=1 Tax=Campylobacter hyointestinalis TaxID=198 RepID=UPI000DCBA1B7|nr:hypothetical protein [Campylobacter hyointestinalis]RAZ63572.1 hypothetical protein CHL9767_06305 [Campylobacter hyointestinalis subsp. lawsonii]